MIVLLMDLKLKDNQQMKNKIKENNKYLNYL